MAICTAPLPSEPSLKASDRLNSIIRNGRRLRSSLACSKLEKVEGSFRSRCPRRVKSCSLKVKAGEMIQEFVPDQFPFRWDTRGGCTCRVCLRFIFNHFG